MWFWWVEYNADRSIQTLLRGENDSKQSDEFQATFPRDRSSFPVPDFPFLVSDILQVPPLITWGKLQKALHNISYE